MTLILMDFINSTIFKSLEKMAGLINNFTKKINYGKLSVIAKKSLIDRLRSECLTEKGNFSIKELEKQVKNIDDIYNSALPENLKSLCESYSQKKNKRKKALAFAERLIAKKNSLKKSNNEFELHNKKKIREFIKKCKPIRTMLNCSNEEFVNILFNDSKVVANVKRTTLLRYLSE